MSPKSYISALENNQKPAPVGPSWTGEPGVQLKRAWKGTLGSVSWTSPKSYTSALKNNQKPAPVGPSWTGELGVSLRTRKERKPALVGLSWIGERGGQLTRAWKGTRSFYPSALEKNENPH
ncbi:hypothetical protein K438DRAFT_1943239 [Mycena galopus ATCC 62051]|nr:hypothetical protein K438DRAFT_1943239 [Mycena galopus ATCC 62051]